MMSEAQIQKAAFSQRVTEYMNKLRKDIKAMIGKQS